MATQTNVPSSVQQSKLAVVPISAPQTITQLELTVLLSLRSRPFQLQAQEESAKQLLKNRLEIGIVSELFRYFKGPAQ